MKVEETKGFCSCSPSREKQSVADGSDPTSLHRVVLESIRIGSVSRLDAIDVTELIHHDEAGWNSRPAVLHLDYWLRCEPSDSGIAISGAGLMWCALDRRALNSTPHLLVFPSLHSAQRIVLANDFRGHGNRHAVTDGQRLSDLFGAMFITLAVGASPPVASVQRCVPRTHRTACAVPLQVA